MNLLLASTTLVLATASFTNAASSGLRKGPRDLQSVFPPYSQQCRDDAGPPFQDDDPNTRYHDGKPAFAVGDCPDPLAEACQQKPKKEAFLEGPIDCGDKGWYCRILEQPGWPTVALTTDLNFGYCNTTDGFNDEGFDQAGHCHGSDNDDTFYWWVRDHWFRGYNGRLRCCCGWDDVTDGAVVNSCDYRRLVTQEENLEDCRDANEEGVTPYRAGCSEDNAPTLGEPIPEDDAQCWEVQNFGEPEDGDEDEDNDNSGSGSGDEDEDEDEENDNSGSGSGDEDEDNEDNEDEDEDNSGSGSGDEDEDEDNEDNEDEDNDNSGSGSGSGSGDEDEDNEDNEDEDNDNSGSGSGSGDEDEDNEENEDEDNDNNNSGSGSGSGDEDEDEDEDNIFNSGSGSGSEDEDDCKNDKSFRFRDDEKKSCKWIGKKEERKEKYCTKKSNGELTSDACPVACDACSDNENNSDEDDNGDESEDENESDEDGSGSGSEEEVDCKNDKSFRFRDDEKKSCKWIGKKDARKEKYCGKKSDGELTSDACPVACDAC